MPGPAAAQGGGGTGGGGGSSSASTGAAAGASSAASGRQIEAFDAEAVLQDKRLLSLEAWGANLLLGLNDGTLLVASQQPPKDSGSSSSVEPPGKDGSEGGAAEAPPPVPAWRVAQTLRQFGDGRIKQLAVARERSMLLCLADDGVNAYVLPALRLKGQAARTRGASLFAWHAASDTLAVAVKRRVLLFKYDGLEFVAQREAALPDAPACMALAGGTLYVGLARRDYVCVDVSTAAVTPLLPAKGAAPCCIVPVSPTEVLLASGAAAVRYGPAGRAIKRSKSSGGGDAAVQWSAPPLAAAVSGPYIVGLCEGGAEARLLEPLHSGDLWQRLALALPGAAAGAAALAPSAAADGSLFAASWQSGAVLRLRPVSFVRQAEQLLALGEHEEALALAALAPPEEGEARRALEDRINLAYGSLLFRQGQFDDAMLHFGMSALAGPLQLLRLFPSLAPPKLLAAAAAEQAAEGEEGGGEGGDAAAAAAAAAVGQEDVASAEPDGEQFVAAVQVLMPYLLSHRSRLAAAAASPPVKPLRGLPPQLEQQQGDSSSGVSTPVAPPPRPQSADIGQSPASRAALVQRRLEGSATAALLDTALLLALLAAPDSGALLRFLQRPNCIDLEAGEAALKGAGRYSELVALYQSKSQHAAALELLRALSQSPGDLPAPAQGAGAELGGLPGVWAAVKYVCRLPPSQRDLPLLSTHARWMLAADPDAGLEMFSAMDPPLPTAAVLAMLTSYAPQLAGAYLEAALAQGAADPATYEQELARIYLEKVVGSGGGSSGSGGSSGGSGRTASSSEAAAAAALDGPPPEAAAEYSKLQQLILSSRHLNCEALLRVVPQQRLLELRAALLERLGRHTEALRIYIHRLRQLPLAEAYCDRAYRRRQQAQREQRHAELSAALRRQRSQREAAAAGAGMSGAAAAAAAPATPSPPAGSARALQFSGGAAAGAPAARLQAPKGASSAEDGADIYLLMVQVLLEEEDGQGGYRPVQRAPGHAVWVEVARLLSRKRDAIQPLHALGLLPGEVPLSAALPFLEGALWGASERRRAAAVGRNLRRSEHIGLLGQLADERQRRILLTPERNCSLCFKRVGTAALVTFPSGLLAHYSCYRRTAAASGASGGGGSATAAAAVGGGQSSNRREWS